MGGVAAICCRSRSAHVLPSTPCCHASESRAHTNVIYNITSASQTHCISPRCFPILPHLVVSPVPSPSLFLILTVCYCGIPCIDVVIPISSCCLAHNDLPRCWHAYAHPHAHACSLAGRAMRTTAAVHVRMPLSVMHVCRCQYCIGMKRVSEQPPQAVHTARAL